jgi:ABC-type uncharacterized transport system substrate-binding protein
MRLRSLPMSRAFEKVSASSATWKAIEIESHFTNGDKQRTRDIVRALIEKQVDIIVPWTTTTVQITMEMTQTIPS